VLGVVGVLGVIVTFVLGGFIWVTIGVFAALVIVCIALIHSLIRLDGKRRLTDARLKDLEESALEHPSLDQAKSSAPSQPEATTTEPTAASEASGQTLTSPPSNAPSEPTNGADHEQSPLGVAWDSAFIKKDADAVDRLLEPWIALAEDPQRPEREAIHAYLLVMAGRHSQISKLAELADIHFTNVNIATWLAMALEFLGEPQKAADEISRRRKKLPGPHLLFLREARLRRKIGQPSRALGLARSALELMDSDPETKATALAEEGYALEELGRRFEAYASFEQALESDPANSAVRFHLAYQYSMTNWHQLAVTHYLVLTAQGEAGMTVNNLGVEFEHFALPILAVESFKEATRSSVALAHGNLALRLIDAGFTEEAMGHIDEGEKLEPANRMVASALSRIRSDREAQDKRRDALDRAGGSLRDIFARFDLRTPCQLPNGEYLTNEGLRIKLLADGDEAYGNFGDWTATAKLEQGFVQLNLKKGTVLPATASGFAVCRDNALIGYVVDYPNRGETTPFTAISPSITA
jgi:tetratricopeptide (TPR) repeat protein